MKKTYAPPPRRKPTEIDRRFNYYPPATPDRRVAHEKTRAAMKRCANFVQKNTPDCREKSLAITKLEEAMFWANAAIARPQGENS